MRRSSVTKLESLGAAEVHAFDTLDVPVLVPDDAGIFFINWGSA